MRESLHTIWAVLLAVLISTAIGSVLTVIAVRSIARAPTSFVRDARYSDAVREDELVRRVVERVSPTVVSITLAAAPGITTGGGSGFFVRPDGYIITNRHVVNVPQTSYLVTLNNGKEYPAKLIGADPVLDLALIKIEEKNVPTVTLGDSSDLFVGQTVLAIGNSLAEFQNSVTKGIISGLGRQIIAGGEFDEAAEVIEGAIQTDAAINPGSSGGPLVSVYGEVIGVNTAVSRRGQLVGFALPINSVKRLIESAVKYGRIVHPWLGVRYRIITPDVAREFKLPVTHGAVIVRGPMRQEAAIAKDSPAANAGLREGDIITQINDTSLTLRTSLAHVVANYRVGDTIKLHVLRGKQTVIIPVMLEEFPAGVQ